MLTLFTTPKPFVGKFNTIQLNAIQSWTLIKPTPEIIILDKAEGSDAVAKKFGLRNIPEVKRNEFGTPLVNSIFETGQAAASENLVCYINTDIILTDSFIKGIQKAQEFIYDKNFLIIGNQWNIFLERPWCFTKGDWQQGLIKYIEYNGYKKETGTIDYFIFHKGMNWNIPPFAIGRGAWDGWFLYNARKMNIPVIDAADFINVYHQRHDHIYLESEFRQQQDIEFKKNKKIRGSFTKQYTIMDSSHILTSRGLKKSPVTRQLTAIFLKIKLNFLYYLHIWHLD